MNLDGMDRDIIRAEIFSGMKTQPENTVGDLMDQLKDVPRDTILRIDAGCDFTPEDYGIVSAGDPRHPFQGSGNNIRWFGVSELGEGVIWIEL